MMIKTHTLSPQSFEMLRLLRFASVVVLIVAALVEMPRLFYSVFAPPEYTLSNKTIHGNEVFKARNLITADSLRIQNGSSVTFRAQQISLGNGFSIGSDVEFIVETTKTED